VDSQAATCLEKLKEKGISTADALSLVRRGQSFDGS